MAEQIELIVAPEYVETISQYKDFSQELNLMKEKYPLVFTETFERGLVAFLEKSTPQHDG